VAENDEQRKRFEEALARGDGLDSVWPEGVAGEDSSIGSLAMHVMFIGHMQAGFSPGQAVYLVAAAMTRNPGTPPAS
jgi:hypothetical protein